jgi:GTP cyclohydrolase IA
MNHEEIEYIGDEHITTSTGTPVIEKWLHRPDELKISKIEKYFEAIMQELGLDLSDDSLSGTPYRVAKMYVKEIFYGLLPEAKPSFTTFSNEAAYHQLMIEKNIRLQSTCEHHFLPIVGNAHIGYIPKDKLIGLSKLNRLVDYYARRPQVQERLCLQIHEELCLALKTKDVIVQIEAEHLCVSTRGIRDLSSSTITTKYSGCFEELAVRAQFINLLK